MDGTTQGKNPMRLDRGEAAFFAREVEHVKARTYDQKLRELKAFELIPVSHEAPARALPRSLSADTKVWDSPRSSPPTPRRTSPGWMSTAKRTP